MSDGLCDWARDKSAGINIEKRYFITFYSPAIICADTWSQDINFPNPHDVVWPERAYAFRLFEVKHVMIGGEVYRKKPVSIGPLYYHPDSKIECLADVRQNPNATEVLIKNMCDNGWDRIIWTRWGTWPQPFVEGEVEILRR